ncbi:MAG: hypothetical protein KDA71_20010, partial [Planctomycetales bacterium]|nr:hypothetical protein [Planctomycetales bacterium]
MEKVTHPEHIFQRRKLARTSRPMDRHFRNRPTGKLRMRDLVLVLFVALVVVLDGCGSKESQSPIEANGGTANSKP